MRVGQEPTDLAHHKQLIAAAALFAGGRLRLARELAGKTKTEVARELGVTPSAISQYEGNHANPTPARLLHMSRYLGMPVEFFEGGRPQAQTEPLQTFFRHLRATTARDRATALGDVELVWEVSQALERLVNLPRLDLPNLPVEPSINLEMIDNIAARVRKHFHVSTDQPVPNVVRLLEAHGVVVARIIRNNTKIDAFSYPFEQRPVVILGADKNKLDRSRFDAAHELGHLVMHRYPGAEAGTKAVEDQAHRFAASFLVPGPALRALLPDRPIKWSTLFEIKRTWKVSLQMLLRRCRDVELISDATYRRTMTYVSERGWRRDEPVPLGPAERPRLLRQALQLLEVEGYGVEALAEEVRLPVEKVRSIVLGTEVRPSLSKADLL